MTAPEQRARLETAWDVWVARKHDMTTQAALLEASTVLAQVVGAMQGTTMAEPLPDRLVEVVVRALEGRVV
jgi:hypothetical protein